MIVQNKSLFAKKVQKHGKKLSSALDLLVHLMKNYKQRYVLIDFQVIINRSKSNGV